MSLTADTMPPMHRSRFIALFAVVGVVLTACGGDPSTVATPAYQAFRDQPTACGAERPAAARTMSFDAPTDLGLTTTVGVTLHTSCGPIELQLYPQLAPVTVNSFVFLAEQGYYDGTVSHRIVPGFMFQAGDPTAGGSGGPGYRIPDELPPADFTYGPGVVAMANAGPGTGGSQFFVMLGSVGLDPDYTVFGAVVGGVDTLVAIASIPIGTNPRSGERSLPLQTLYLESITVDR